MQRDAVGRIRVPRAVLHPTILAAILEILELRGRLTTVRGCSICTASKHIGGSSSLVQAAVFRDWIGRNHCFARILGCLRCCSYAAPGVHFCMYTDGNRERPATVWYSLCASLEHAYLDPNTPCSHMVSWDCDPRAALRPIEIGCNAGDARVLWPPSQ